MECEDAQAWECIVQVRESVMNLVHYCREAAHDGDVVL
jgi:hypothetical protein